MNTEQDAGAPVAGGLHSGQGPAYLVPTLLAVVFFVGIGFRFQGEVFPVANWGMFSQVPSRGVYYTMLVHEVDGKAISPPVPASAHPDLAKAFNTRQGVAAVKELCTAIAGAASGKDGAFKVITAARAKVEGLLGGHKAVYEPVELRCDPLVYLGTRRAERETTFGVFRRGEPLNEETLKRHAPVERTEKGTAP